MSDGRDPQTILAERARRLARPIVQHAHADHTLEALVVDGPGGRYALPLAEVVEILRADDVTPLPGATPPLVGVAPWRGRALGVLSLGGATRGDGARLVIVGDPRTPVALLVNVADDVRTLPATLARDETIEPTTDDVPSLGVTPDAIVVIDVAALRRRVTGS